MPTNSLQNHQLDIGQLFIGAGLLSQQDLDQIISTGGYKSGFDLVQEVVSHNIATEDVVAELLAKGTGFSYVNNLRREEDFHGNAFSEIETDFLKTLRVAPYDRVGSLLKVAVADSTGIHNLEQFAGQMEQLTLEPHIIPLSRLDSALNIIEEKKGAAQDHDTAAPLFSGSVVEFVDLLLHTSIADGASDIHVEPFDKEAMIRRRIDGIMQIWPTGQFLFQHYAAITTRIKILSGLNISEKRLPQDGAIALEHEGDEVDMRVSVLPCLFGERIVIRILNKGGLDMNINSLGFGELELKHLKQAVDSPQGMVLVTGPTGSGKSTTLYSIINRINSPEKNILTAEDPVEYQMGGIGQVQVKEEIGLTFSAALRSFLRQDPEVILVGEIRDRETVDIAIKAALTGHLVLSTLHTNDAPSTITRLVNMGVPTYLITSSLTLIVAQRLARKNCPSCRVVDTTVSCDRLVEIGFTAEEAERVDLYHGEGCPKCKGSGYKGRTGIYEVLQVTERIHEAIDRDASAEELESEARKEGFRTIQEVAREMLVSGDLSFLEFGRVIWIG